jgi:hypothetical protein
MKKERQILSLLLFGQIAVAQTVSLRPALSFTCPFNKFVSSTVPEPLFSTTLTRSGDASIAVEYNFKKNDYIYFKFASFSFGNSMRQAYDRKTEFLDFIFGESVIGSGDNTLRFGTGLKKDLIFNGKRRSLYFLIGLNFDIQSNIDTLGSISFPYSSILIIDDWKSTKYKKWLPSFEIAFAHPILNKKKKEVIELSLSYSQSFGVLHQKTMYFRYNGPRYGSNDVQKAIFESRGQAFQFTISKAINIIRKK